MHLSKILSAMAAVIAVAGLSACATATNYSLSPVASPAQALRYQKGTPTVRSDKASGTVTVSTTEPSNSYHLGLLVAATNKSPEPADLGVENVQIVTAAGAPVKIYTYAELKSTEEAAAATMSLLYALGGISEAAAASQPETTTISYSDGSRTVIKSTSPAASSAARNISLGEAEGRIADVNASTAAEIAELDATILQTTTLDPGDTLAGKVETERPKLVEGAENTLTVTVDFAGDRHEFRFVMQPKP